MFRSRSSRGRGQSSRGAGGIAAVRALCVCMRCEARLPLPPASSSLRTCGTDMQGRFGGPRSRAGGVRGRARHCSRWSYHWPARGPGGPVPRRQLPQRCRRAYTTGQHMQVGVNLHNFFLRKRPNKPPCMSFFVPLMLTYGARQDVCRTLPADTVESRYLLHRQVRVRLSALPRPATTRAISMLTCSGVPQGRVENLLWRAAELAGDQVFSDAPPSTRSGQLEGFL